MSEYRILLVSTEEEIAAVREIRREVYGKKFSLGDEALEAQGFIWNEEDRQSFIYLLEHIPSSTYVGTTRLTFVRNNTPIQALSMQQHGVKKLEGFDTNTAAVEVSRFALSSQHIAGIETVDSTLRNILSLELMIAVRLTLFLYPSPHVFSFMERSLYVLLRRRRTYFRKIGPSVNVLGERTPYYIEREKLLADTERLSDQGTRYYLKEFCKNPGKLWAFVDGNPYLDRSDIRLEYLCEIFEKYGDDADVSLLIGEDMG